MITNFKKYKMNENLSNFDLTKLKTITAINKDENGNWIYTTKESGDLFLPKESVGKITLIDDNFANFVNSGNPITKYFELEDDRIIYAANFAVDIVAICNGRVYLIERKDGRGWALPGGFIDAGENPEHAAVRELMEETLAKKDDIKDITPLQITRANDPREVNFFSVPFMMNIKSTAELKFADDAINGKWLYVARAIKNKLAFSHHNNILKQVNY